MPLTLNHLSPSTHCLHSPPPPIPPSPTASTLTRGSDGTDTRCSGHSAGVRARRDLTSSFYGKGRSPLYYLLMERSSSANRKGWRRPKCKTHALPYFFHTPCQQLPSCPPATHLPLSDARQQEGERERWSDTQSVRELRTAEERGEIRSLCQR